jgi:hypothetical protein
MKPRHLHQESDLTVSFNRPLHDRREVFVILPGERSGEGQGQNFTTQFLVQFDWHFRFLLNGWRSVFHRQLIRLDSRLANH